MPNKSEIIYSGVLPDQELQVKVANFAKTYGDWLYDPLIILPEPDRKVATVFQKGADSVFYPFNYFGVIEGKENHFSLILDRTDGGRLVVLEGLPVCGASSYGELIFDWHSEPSRIYRSTGATARDAHWPFALMLHVIRMRYWPDITVQDDEHESYEKLRHELLRYQLIPALCDESLGFYLCHDLYWREHKRRNPDPDPEPEPVPELVQKPRLRLVRYKKDELNILPVNELELSVRTARCLDSANIRMVGELIKYSPADLLKIRNLGRKSVNELQDVLWELGLGVGLRDDKEDSDFM